MDVTGTLQGSNGFLVKPQWPELRGVTFDR